MTWQRFRRLIPRLLLHNAIPDRLGKQSSYILAVESCRLVVRVQLVQLRTKIESMNPGIIAIQTR